MKLISFIFLLFMTLINSAHAIEEAPPYQIPDPAINENFRQIYYGLSQHAHTGDDGTVEITASASGSSNFTAPNPTGTVILFNSGGPVSIATHTFMPLDGLYFGLGGGCTSYFSEFQAFIGYTSTVAVTKFQMQKSSQNALPSSFSPWGPQIHSTTATTTGAPTWGTPISSAMPAFPTEHYSLHITSIPPSGLQSRGFKITGKRYQVCP